MSIPFYWDSLLWYSSLVRKNAVFKTPISLLLLLPFYSSYHTQKKPSFIRTWKQNGSILCDSAAYSRRSTTLCSIFMQRSIVRKCSILNLAMIDKKKAEKRSIATLLRYENWLHPQSSIILTSIYEPLCLFDVKIKKQVYPKVQWNPAITDL